MHRLDHLNEPVIILNKVMSWLFQQYKIYCSEFIILSQIKHTFDLPHKKTFPYRDFKYNTFTSHSYMPLCSPSPTMCIRHTLSYYSVILMRPLYASPPPPLQKVVHVQRITLVTSSTLVCRLNLGHFRADYFLLEPPQTCSTYLKTISYVKIEWK